MPRKLRALFAVHKNRQGLLVSEIIKVSCMSDFEPKPPGDGLEILVIILINLALGAAVIVHALPVRGY